MLNPLDSEMTDEGRALIEKNVRVSSIRSALNLSPIDETLLSDDYQQEIIRQVLSHKPSVLERFEDFDSSKFRGFSDNSSVHPRLKNIECLDDYFQGEEDSFELRVAKSRLLPSSESLYCHGSTLYLSGVLSKSFWLHEFGEYSAKTILSDIQERASDRNLRSDLELKVQLYHCFREFNHSNIVRDGLVFDRLHNGAEFRIIPENEYIPHDGSAYCPTERVESFRTFYKEFENLELDRILHEELK